MELLTGSPIQLAVAAVCVALVGFLFTQPNGLVKWVQKKNYQYEVTSSLYMLTPTEKFVFNSILFLTFSMLATACILYLPDHVMTMSSRAYYYFVGDVPAGQAGKQAAEILGKTVDALASTASSTLAGSASAEAVV